MFQMLIESRILPFDVHCFFQKSCIVIRLSTSLCVQDVMPVTSARLADIARRAFVNIWAGIGTQHFSAFTATQACRCLSDKELLFHRGLRTQQITTKGTKFLKFHVSQKG